MATVVLSNHKFPEDGQVSVPLPIPAEEYDHCMHVYNTRDYNCVPMCYIWVNGATSCASHFSGYDNTVSWSGHTVSWYSNNAEQQFNENNKIYHYLVIG